MYNKLSDVKITQGPGGSMSQVVGLPNNSYKPITNTAWVHARLCKLQKGCTRFAAASDKVYQLLAHGRWFSPGTPASSTAKTGRHDIAEIQLKVALNTKNQNQINQNYFLRNKCFLINPKIIQERVGIPLTALTLPHFCACLKPGPGFPLPKVLVFFCVQLFEVRGYCSFC